MAGYRAHKQKTVSEGMPFFVCSLLKEFYFKRSVLNDIVMDHPFSGASEFFPGRDVPPPFDFAQDGGIPGT
jgi:hypothetical protein